MRPIPMLSLAALMLAAAVPAGAQDLSSLVGGGAKERTWHIGVGGGVSVPIADAKDALDNGVNGQVYFSWAPRLLPWALRATANYDRHSLKGLTAGQDGTGTLLGGLGGFTLGMPAGPVRPYVTLGLGAFNVASDVSGVGGKNTSSTKLGMDAGVGVQLKLGTIGAFVEGRIQNVFNSDTGTAGAKKTLETLKTQIVPVTFGLHF